MKLRLLFTLLMSILFLTGCTMIADFFEDETYEVTFHTNGGSLIDTITVTDFSLVDLSRSHTTTREGYIFVGWYIDSDLITAYIPNNDYKSDLELFAGWNAITFNVSIFDTYSLETVNHTIIYGQTLESITYSHTALRLISYRKVLDDQEILPTHEVFEDLELYTVFEAVTGYHIVTFDTGGIIDIADQVVLEGEILSTIEKPEHPTLIFYAWYLDAEFNQIFDLDQTITNDFTLYARFIEPSIHTYELDDSTLSWNQHTLAVAYDILINNQDTGASTVLATTENNYIDLRPYESSLKDVTTITVIAIFETTASYELFSLDVMFDYIEPIYNEDFEGESFEARTNYVNNTIPRIDGSEGNLYNILNGSASTTNPIEGLKSVQLRNNTNTPYLETQFYFENIAEVRFLGRSYNHHVTLHLMPEIGQVPLESHLIEMDSNIQSYQVKISTSARFRLKFELTATSDLMGGEQVFIDLIEVFSQTSATMLMEVFTDAPVDPDLEAIIARFATQRGNLTPPGFNALTETGLLNYYADLNGLTGDAFRQTLTNILTTTHRRLISYDEARFILEQSDLVQVSGKSYLDGIYSGHEIMPYWDGGATWAREHVWPNSRLGIPRVTGSSRNIGSDVHNLRAINPSVNSSRSNRYFMEGTSFGLVGTEAYFPGDAYKGDVARILFYMLARYPDILTLRDDNIIDNAYEANGAVMGILSLLLAWHYSDPVSLFEIHRNNVIYSYQGNRNPFIDFPEYVDVYFN